MLIMLEACGTVAEKRSDNITKDIDFIYAEETVSCSELWQIHEVNKRLIDSANKRFKQIRKGSEWQWHRLDTE